MRDETGAWTAEWDAVCAEMGAFQKPDAVPGVASTERVRRKWKRAGGVGGGCLRLGFFLRCQKNREKQLDEPPESNKTGAGTGTVHLFNNMFKKYVGFKRN